MDVQYQDPTLSYGKTDSYGVPIRSTGAPLIREASKVGPACVHDKYLEIWLPESAFYFIGGFHMTSLKDKLQNYRSYWDFTFMVY